MLRTPKIEARRFESDRGSTMIAAILIATSFVGCGQEPRLINKRIDDKKDGASEEKKLPDSVNPQSKDFPPAKVEAKKSDEPKVVKSKTPRAAVEAKFVSVPVYYGTNRKPKASYESNFQGEFAQFFIPTPRMGFGLYFSASYLFTIAIIAASDWRRKQPAARPASAILMTVAAIAFATVPYAILGGDGLVIGPMLVISFIVFVVFPAPRERSMIVQFGLAALMWGIVYTGIAVFAAKINAEREQNDPGSIYGNLRLAGISYGRCDVTVPASYIPGTGVIPRPMRVATIELNEDPAQHIVLHEVLTLDEEAFFRRVREDVDKPDNPDKELFVFVHGFNNTFKDGVYRTALIARDLDFPGPSLLFSWPSRGEAQDYVADIDAVDYSKRYVREFIQKTTKHSGAKRIYLFAHSMGNVALTEALQRLFERDWPEKDAVKEVVFAAPDVLQDTFRDQILPDIRGKGPRLTLYASSHDVALSLSKAAHKGLRAGQGGDDIVLAAGLDTVDASSLGKPLFDLGHNYAFATPSLRRDLQLLFKGSRPPRDTLKEQRRGELTYWLVRPLSNTAE